MKISKDFSAGNLHAREDLFVTGSIGALNSEIIVPCDGGNSFSLDLRGTFSLTIEISGTVDGTNWTPIPARPINTASVAYVATVAGTAAGVWVGKCGQYKSIRARCTAYTSGSATSYLLSSTALIDDTLNAQVSTLAATATAAAATIVTLTLAAPGAGLRQYVTGLNVSRFATALLTAAAAPVIVTSTNLPGTPSYNFPADAAAQGALNEIQKDFGFPLAASAQNTAVTFVAPATTGVIFKLTATYYNAP